MLEKNEVKRTLLLLAIVKTRKLC